MTATILGAASAAIWVYLIALRGGFWRIRVEPAPGVGAAAARVMAVIPARDEAAVIGRAVSSLLAQRYRDPFQLDRRGRPQQRRHRAVGARRGRGSAPPIG